MRGRDEPQPPADAPSDELKSFGFDGSGDAWLDRFQEADVSVALGSIGPYEVVAEVGRGGQGVVYLARQPGMGRDVAVKRLLAGSFATASMRRRFEREIQAVSALNHPNIVTVFAMDVVDSQPVLAMEWVDGLPVTRWAAGESAGRSGSNGRREPNAIIEMFVRICDAVHHAHQHGVIHRDLKPSNILVDAEGCPHLLDFGLAKLIETSEAGAEARSASESFVGTAAYASPEQVEGKVEQVGIPTDVYSLGVLLFETLTGRAPYRAGLSLLETLEAVRSARPARPSSVGAGLNVEIDAIVLKALAKEPEGRYPSVDALAADLRRFLAGEPVLAHPPGNLYHLRKAAGRHRVAFAATAAAAVLIVGFAVVAGLMARAAVNAREEERRARDVAESVSQFLSDTLAVAGPSRRGADVKLLDVLNDASERANTQLAGRPAVAAEVHYTIGFTYRKLWRWREARPHLEKALSLARELHAGDDANTAKCLTALGTVYTSLRKPEAVDLHREALAMRRRLFGERHELVAQSMTKLAYALHQGLSEDPQWEAAEGLFVDALAMYRELLGDNHREVGSCLHNFGWMRYTQQRYRDAEALYAEALGVFRAIGDLGDPYYAECLWGYTALLDILGWYEQNVDALWETIPLIGRTYGRFRTVPLLWNQARAYQNTGDYQRAEACYRQGLSLLCERLVEEAPEAVESLAPLRLALLRAARDEGAASPDREILEALPRLGDSARDELVYALRRYAELYLAQGQHEKAETLFSAVNRIAAEDGRTEFVRASALEGLGEIAEAREEDRAAVELLDEGLRRLRAARPRRRWEHARVMGKLAASLAGSGRLDEADTLLGECVEIFTSTHGADHRFTLAARERLAELAAGRGSDGG